MPSLIRGTHGPHLSVVTLNTTTQNGPIPPKYIGGSYCFIIPTLAHCRKSTTLFLIISPYSKKNSLRGCHGALYRIII